MATKQKYRLGIIEGDIYIFAKAGEAMDCHDVVMLSTSTADTFMKCTSTGIPFGFVAEQVTLSGVADYEPGGLVSHVAKVGDYVGVYIDGGVYNHAISGLTKGTYVYAGTAFSGKLSATTGTAGVVGIVLQDTDSDGLAKVKSLL